MATVSIIDKLYADHKAVLEFLEKHNEVSLKNIADDRFKKLLLLAAASYFEFLIQDLILQFVSRQTNANTVVISIVKAKAVDRQYHTYFDWSSRNANQFFALFGSEFSEAAKEKVANDSELEESVRAFLEIGKTRNALTHQNIGNYFLDKTAEEIHGLYTKAARFIVFLSSQLQDFPDTHPVPIPLNPAANSE